MMMMMTVSPAKVAESILMPFSMLTQVISGNHVLLVDQGPDPPWEGAHLRTMMSGYSHMLSTIIPIGWPQSTRVTLNFWFTAK